jgi:hypothetical protein
MRSTLRFCCGALLDKQLRQQLGQHRSTQRKIPKPRNDEAALTAAVIALAVQYGRYGYRRITKMLCATGWRVSFKQVERIWRREGLKVPAKQPKHGRLWLNDGSCIRLRPEYSNHVWSYDFVEDRTHNGRKYRMLNVIDEFTRECIAIRVNRRLRSTDVIDVLSDLFILRGIPGTSALIMARSLLPGQCANGSRRSGPRPPTSCREALGRMDIARASTRSFAMSCSKAKSSTHWSKPRSSSKVGGATTTLCVRTHRSVTNHPLPRLGYGRLRNPAQLRRPRRPWRQDQS